MAEDHAPPFDPDVWGASPNWDLAVERSVYDDDDLHEDEPVPRARSLVAAEAEGENMGGTD